MIKLKTINNEVVRAIHYQEGGEQDNRPVKGSKLFEELYCNCFMVARKKSGKTTVLNKIVRDCTTFESRVIVFSSTIDKDNNHLALKHYCKEHGIPYIGYTSMKDEDIDVLDVLIKKLQNEAEPNQSDSEEEVENEKHGLLLFDSESEDEEVEKKPRKSKYKAPEYLIILDDLSNELKSKTLVKLLKMNRHFRCKIFISSQYMNDLLPESIKQMDYCLIFRGEPELKLIKLHENLDLSIDFELFKKLYYDATKEKYSFLYIDVRQEKFRRNFNKQYLLV
jgi:hypothetical protein